MAHSELAGNLDMAEGHPEELPQGRESPLLGAARISAHTIVFRFLPENKPEMAGEQFPNIKHHYL